MSADTSLRMGLDYASEEVDARLAALVQDSVASRIAAKDATLWGPDAEAEAGKRLNWVDASANADELVAEVLRLRDEFAASGLDLVVLCGMGGSSLAPEVICDANGVDLVVVDSSDPDFVRKAVSEQIERTVVVVSSKSGGTVETDSQKRAFEQAFTDAGIDPAERLIIVTDPGSPLEQSSKESGYRVFTADPEVGGRYSALTAFGLVPSGLAGADIAGLVAEAETVRHDLATDDRDNPALGLGAMLGIAAQQGADKMVLADDGSPYPRLGDWIEQLVAESTGKQGIGILPVVVESVDAINASPSTPDSVLVTYGSDRSLPAGSGFSASVDAPLGAAMLLWEYATAVVGLVLGINPFDQPDVESAKAAARDMLEGSAGSPTARFTDRGVEVFAGDWLSGTAQTLEEAVGGLLSHLDPQRGYLAVQVYTDRHRDEGVATCRELLAERTQRPVTFGWGPRFLHSTGQFHKGGPPVGVFLQITCDPEEDLPVPGREFTFSEFLSSQAVGDASVLQGQGRPVLRFHYPAPSALTDLGNHLG